MKYTALLLLACLLSVSVGQKYGNSELRDAINTAMGKWQAGSAASDSWKKWYNSNYNNPSQCTGFSYPQNPVAGGTLAEVIRKGELNIGSDFPSPPLYFTQSGSSDLVGFDVDFQKFLASELSTQYKKTITVKRTYSAFGSLLANLNAQQFDVASGGMIPNDDRKKIVSFSCNISAGGLGGAVSTANQNTYKTIDDILKTGVNIGLLAGTIQETVAKQAGANIIYISTLGDAYPLLQNGTIAVWLGSQNTISYWAASNPTQSIYQIPQWGTVNGIAWAIRNDTASPPSTGAGFSLSASLSFLVLSVFALLF